MSESEGPWITIGDTSFLWDEVAFFTASDDGRRTVISFASGDRVAVPVTPAQLRRAVGLELLQNEEEE